MKWTATWESWRPSNLEERSFSNKYIPGQVYQFEDDAEAQRVVDVGCGYEIRVSPDDPAAFAELLRRMRSTYTVVSLDGRQKIERAGRPHAEFKADAMALLDDEDFREAVMAVAAGRRPRPFAVFGSWCLSWALTWYRREEASDGAPQAAGKAVKRKGFF
jgi:hypothetical protein